MIIFRYSKLTVRNPLNTTNFWCSVTFIFIVDTDYLFLDICDNAIIKAKRPENVFRI